MQLGQRFLAAAAVCGVSLLAGCSSSDKDEAAAVPQGPAGVITVTSASYGTNVDAHAASNNAIGDVAKACNGQAKCAYKIDYHTIGDPFLGKAKSYELSYHCGDGQERNIAVPAEADATEMSLHCP
jgi:outer membrane murein-binding lipoprotein Lpp